MKCISGHDKVRCCHLRSSFVPERIRTELFKVIGNPFLSHVIAGKGIPEASQTREMGFFSTVLIFSGRCRKPPILGGTTTKSKEKPYFRANTNSFCLQNVVSPKY